MSEFVHRLAIPLAIALLVEVAGSLLIMQQPQWLKHFDQPVLDAFTRWQLTQRTPEDIVIVDIDDQSLQRIAPWPWPRDVISTLLQKIEQAHPLGIGLDIVFPEPRDAKADQALAHQVQNSTVRVCIAQAFDLHGSEPRHIGALAAGWPVSPGIAAIAASGYVGNYPQLAKAARCAGHITPWLDADGLLRRLPGQIRFNQQTWTFLSAAMLGRTATVQPAFVTVPYRIRPQNWLALPAWRLLLGQADPAMLEGRWVLIGSSALGLGDKVTTPIHPWMPGVVVHAELLDGLLRPLPDPPISPLWFVWMSLTLLVMSMTVLIMHKRLYAALAVALAIALGWMGGAYLLWQSRVYFPVTVPWIASGLMILTLLPWAWWRLYQQQRHIRRLFEGYVSPEVVSQLLQAPQDTLAPQKKQVTVLFADITGFTQLSERLSTEKLAEITRQVLTILTEQVHRHQGTVDKYIGDAVMAFWNAPLSQPDHAQRAYDCALGMVQALDHWNRTRDEPVHIHIALHTGEVMVGDLGTSWRHAYTVIGRTVNVADRLLKHAKLMDRPIVLTPAVRQRINTFDPALSVVVDERPEWL